MSKGAHIKRPIIPAAVTAVLEGIVASVPWYQFFDDMNRLLTTTAFPSAVTFASSNTTTGLGAYQFYRFTGSTGATLSLEGNVLDLGNADSVFVFSVVDEGGSAGTNPISISGGAATISGSNVVTINEDYGSLTFYSNGSEFFVLG